MRIFQVIVKDRSIDPILYKRALSPEFSVRLDRLTKPLQYRSVVDLGQGQAVRPLALWSSGASGTDRLAMTKTRSSGASGTDRLQ